MDDDRRLNHRSRARPARRQRRDHRPHTLNALRPDGAARLLHPRSVRMLRQSGPLRRGEVRLRRARRRVDVGRHGGQPQTRLRPRGEAAHPARRLRALGRLLRRLLPPGAEGAHADQARVRPRLRRARRDRRAPPPPPSPSGRARSPTRIRCTSTTSTRSRPTSPVCRRFSVPGGFGKDGMPVGLQFVGQRLDESTLLGVANAYEQLTRWPIVPPGNVGST